MNNSNEDYSCGYKNGSGNTKYVDIYSSEKKKVRRSRIPVLRILSFLFFLCLGIIGGAMIYGYNTLHSFN